MEREGISAVQGRLGSSRSVVRLLLQSPTSRDCHRQEDGTAVRHPRGSLAWTMSRRRDRSVDGALYRLLQVVQGLLGAHG